MKKVSDEIAIAIVKKDFEWLYKNYEDRVPKGLKIAEIVDSMEEQNILDEMVKRDYQGDRSDPDGLYIISNNGGYISFHSERGLGHNPMSFDNLKDACFWIVDYIFRGLGHKAPDTKYVFW